MVLFKGVNSVLVLMLGLSYWADANNYTVNDYVYQTTDESVSSSGVTSHSPMTSSHSELFELSTSRIYQKSKSGNADVSKPLRVEGTVIDEKHRTIAHDDSISGVTSNFLETSSNEAQREIVSPTTYKDAKEMASYISNVENSTTALPGRMSTRAKTGGLFTFNMTSSTLASSVTTSDLEADITTDDEMYDTATYYDDTDYISGTTSSPQITTVSMQLSKSSASLIHKKARKMETNAPNRDIPTTESPDDQNCRLPTKAQFRRTIYRPYSGERVTNYSAESIIKSGTRIVAICKDDVIGDLIIKRTVSICRHGRWRPKLPQCIVKKRCDVPPFIEDATPSETISPYQTFPHTASITYTCNTGKMATGNSTMVCDDGQWSNKHFKCKDVPNRVQHPDLSDRCVDPKVPNGSIHVRSVIHGIYYVKCNIGFRVPTGNIYMCKNGEWIGAAPKCVLESSNKVQGPNLGERCVDLRVPNGRISTRNVTHSVYHVTCNAGFRVQSGNMYRCKDGKWIGAEPKCVRATARCRFDMYAKRWSYFKSVKTGRIVNLWTVTHRTELIQFCKNSRSKRRVKCINGRWTPSLRKCSHNRFHRNFARIRNSSKQDHLLNKSSKFTDRIRSRRSTSACTIPRMKGGPSIFTTYGNVANLPVGELVQHGQEVHRQCLDEGFMLLPGVQMNRTVTSKCQNGNWTPNFPRCLRDIKDTVFYDDIIEETTNRLTTTEVTSATTTTSTTYTTSTTPIPSARYKIHLEMEGIPETYIFINDPGQGFALKLTDNTTHIDAMNVGEIKKIRFGSNDSWDTLSPYPPTGVNFVSIYMSDTDGMDKFYIVKYSSGQQGILGPPCARSFKDFRRHTVRDWKSPDMENTYDDVDSLSSCKLKCVEEDKFDCKAIYFSSKHGKCTVFAFNVSPKSLKADHLTVSRRVDECT